MSNEFIITALTFLNKKKTLVTINYEAAFSLYNSEIRKFNLKEGAMVSEEQLVQIREEILYPRARERAVYLTLGSFKTSAEIFSKLRAGYYPQDVCERVLQFLTEYGYVNDYEYAKAYVGSHIPKKSVRYVSNALRTKGIAENIIGQVLQGVKEDEAQTIVRLIEKKGVRPDELDYRERTRLCASLMRKGYDYDDICKAVNCLIHKNR